MDSIDENPLQSTPDRQMPDEVIDLTMVEDEDYTSNVKQEDGVSQTAHQSPDSKVQKENDVIDLTMVEAVNFTSSVKQEDSNSQTGQSSHASSTKDDDESLFVPDRVSSEPDQTRMKRKFSTAQEIDNLINSAEDLRSRRSREISQHDGENESAGALETGENEDDVDVELLVEELRDYSVKRDKLQAVLAKKAGTLIERRRLEKFEKRVREIEVELQRLRPNTNVNDYTQEEPFDNESVEEPAVAARPHRGPARTAKEWFDRHFQQTKDDIDKKLKILNDKPVTKPETPGKRRRGYQGHARTDAILRRYFTTQSCSKIMEARMALQDLPEAERRAATTQKKQIEQTKADVSEHCNSTVAKFDIKRLQIALRSFGLHNCKANGTWATARWWLDGLESKLHNHQLLGVSWMLEREFGPDKGGILADEMGLGKTLQTLACMVHNKPTDSDPKTTLIVAPASAITQWISELDKHIAPGSKLTHTHFKASKLESKEFLGKCDVIITSYQEVQSSWLPPKIQKKIKAGEYTEAEQQELREQHVGVLFKMDFWRVVLDEAHAIKNHDSQTSIACRNVSAKHRWALSGTPFHNTPLEIWPYLKFLQVPWAGTLADFRKRLQLLEHPTNSGQLQTIIEEIMQRRIMSDTIFGLPLWEAPEIRVEHKWINHTEEERIIYRCVEARYREILTFLLRSLRKKDRQAKLKDIPFYLVFLSRLRQAAAHPFLLEPAIKETLIESDIRGIKDQCNKIGTRTPVYEQIELFYHEREFGTSNFGCELDMEAQLDMALRFKDESYCMLCETELTESQENKCGHKFCLVCIHDEVYRPKEAGEGRAVCPVCEEALQDWRPVQSQEPAGTPGAEQEHPVQFSDRQLAAFNDLGTNPEEFRKAMALKEQHDRLRDGHAPVNKGVDGKKLGNDYLDNQPRLKSSKTSFLKALDKDYPKPMVPSAKTTMVKHTVLQWQADAPNDKIIIFTQFLQESMILGRMLQAERKKFVYFFGQMSSKDKSAAIAAFHELDDVKIMIASLKCGGVALNLTCANRVILVDPWWNAPMENQAFGRVYRIGQKKKTYLQSILVRDTIDERMHKLQKEKSQKIEAAMQYSKSLSVDEVMNLIGNLTEDENGDPILEADYKD
ncbi:P-loop containing nucleoside triphosphate hydrolase [Apiospora arundinis]